MSRGFGNRQIGVLVALILRLAWAGALLGPGGERDAATTSPDTQKENGTCAASLDCVFDPVDLKEAYIGRGEALLRRWSQSASSIIEEGS
jgi:hypothetical protein